MTKSRNGGFTLVELLVTITVGVIVTFAATTVLLLCLRVHNQSSATATRQNEIRIGLTVMENLLAENTITNVAPNQIKNGDGENDVLLIYSEETGTISTGAGATVPLTGFGHALCQGVKHAVEESGLIGAFTGGLSATAGGITAAILFGTLVAFLFKPHAK